MITFSLQSGSNGNAIYVEAAGRRLLFDAGITGACAQRRMAVHGRFMQDVEAVIISHDHIDHVRYAGVYQRKFGIPIYITKPTLQATWVNLGRLPDLRMFCSGDTLDFGDVVVHTVRTAHDAVDGVAFVVECEGKRLGILTDLGHPFSGLLDLLGSIDAAYLECNYDPRMLEESEYPPHLKARIRGDGGHLSNDESADLLLQCGRRKPKWLAVAHLSHENNLPELAIGSQHEAVGRDYPVYLASRYECSPLLEV
ncbi:MAG: MBL fold metallo-hydrolase [Planctomycetota bacterium]